MQKLEPRIRSRPVVARQRLVPRADSKARVEKVGSMKIARKLCITVATMAVSLGLVAIAAPAEASRDTSWGCGGLCIVLPGSPDS